MSRYATRAALAGALIGIGDVAMLEAENRIVGALLFTVALLCIIRLGLPLYTGRVGPVVRKRNWQACSWFLLWNLAGSIVVTMLYQLLDEKNEEKMREAARLKFSRGFLVLFVAGMFCNVLVHVAVVAKSEVITILCVMGFILCGFEHSIADFPYVCMNGWYFPEWFAVLAGNTAGAVLTEALLARDGDVRKNV